MTTSCPAHLIYPETSERYVLKHESLKSAQVEAQCKTSYYTKNPQRFNVEPTVT